ncbi:MAG: hypothetical protein ACI8RZ_007288 [Myxococcota bacterium]
MTLDDLLALPRPDLLRTVQEGHPIDLEAMADTEYLGVSLGMPAWVDALAWKTFMKTFHADPQHGLRGWNVRLEQDGLDAPPRPMEKGGEAITFGHYAARTIGPDDVFRDIQSGLMLDYGAGGNPWWDPAGFIRDPLVALHPGETDLLLGWSTVRLGSIRLPTPSFFALRRIGPLTHCIGVPSGR